jgi:glycosyltransferase involved in cell wall biosynthesis
MKITATVVTLNEEQNIGEALESISWADEIIIVDSESTDRTVEIARQYTDQIFIRPWPGYSAQKNFASEKASHDWIFNLDADERVSPDLVEEIESLKRNGEPSASGFELPRRTFYLGRWIKHSGWYPDFKVRLYNRRVGRWRGDYVHESVEVDGRVARLSGALLHYTVRNASEHHLRIDLYTTLAAEEMLAEGRQISVASLLFSPVMAFVRSYIFRRGFLDGVPGLAIAAFAAHYVFLKGIKLWEKRRANDREPGQR